VASLHPAVHGPVVGARGVGAREDGRAMFRILSEGKAPRHGLPAREGGDLLLGRSADSTKHRRCFQRSQKRASIWPQPLVGPIRFRASRTFAPISLPAIQAISSTVTLTGNSEGTSLRRRSRPTCATFGSTSRGTEDFGELRFGSLPGWFWDALAPPIGCDGDGGGAEPAVALQR
jgi:hypothetical protein